MTLPASGPLTFADIQTEFGGTNPIALNEYYAGGGLVPAGTSGTYGAVPSSGALSVQNFYGTSNYIPVYVEELFQTWLYNGNGGAQTITNGIDLSGKGGLVWTKNRETSFSHRLVDTVRGATYQLISNDTLESQQAATGLTSFTSTGYTLGGQSGYNGATYPSFVSWTFREQPKFFDIVTYTGTGVARTIAHNLGSVPGCIIIKRTSDSGTEWYVYHRANTSGGSAQSQELRLSKTNSTNTNTDVWNNTAPTSSVFSIGAGSSPYDWNGVGGTFIAYLFAHNAGGFGLTGTDNVISCGSYTGNGSATGPVVTLGYEPQWLMIKRATGSANGNWVMLDVMRGFSTSTDNELYANLSLAEGSGLDLAEPQSTGFQLKSGSSGVNASGSDYIYIAIRRGPMKVPTLGTTVYGAVARSGTGASATITSLSFPPDLLIDKARNAGYEPSWWDKLRGTNQVLLSSSTNADTTTTDSVNAFGQTGVSIGADGGGYINNSGANYINWFFRRAPSFFDEVCYTGTGITTTQTHNLGAVPELIIVKGRNATAAFDWTVNPCALGSDKTLYLNATNAMSSDSSNFTNTAPTSTIFNLDVSWSTNRSAGTYVAYLFATCAGVSKVGTYTGTGALQTINCGFSSGSRFVLIKRTDSTGGWYTYDSARGISSGNDPYLLLNSTAAEVTGTNYVDTTSVGFQVTAAAPAALNASGGTYIFLAIA